ncbi:hypothetical protein [Candidatus Enterovibrio altilux]|nr:hypothetical protein [Candidatus Enterovibrio luxaltus]
MVDKPKQYARCGNVRIDSGSQYSVKHTLRVAISQGIFSPSLL